MRFSFCLALLVLVGNPLLGLAQDLNLDMKVAACFYQVNISGDEPTAYLADCFKRELRLKLKDRPFNIELYNGSRDNFELWANSRNYPYIFAIDITEQGWVTNRPFSIPFIFNIYRSSYMIKAYVKMSAKEDVNTLLNKSYYVKVNGREAYQILYNDPNDGELTVSFSKQKLIEKRARQKLARSVSNDICKILKDGG
jgi:hypothetical protein